MGNQDATPEADAAQARQAFAAGDLKHALHHLGCALTSNPFHPEWMQLLNQIMERSGDPLKLTEIEGDTSFVDAANRSYALAWVRRWEEALDLITDVAEIRPDIPYLLWAEWWLGQPGVAQSLTFDQFARGILVDFAKIASRCPLPTKPDDPRRANLEAAARILASVRGLYARESFVWFTGSMLGRRLGNLDEALAMAQHAYTLEPAWKNAIGVANVLRDQKKLEEAAGWFKKSLEHDPKDVSSHLDCGDMFLDAQRWDDAIKQYEAAIKKEADHPWAVASIYFARFRQHGDATQRLCLLRCAEEGNNRAEMLAEQLDPPRPYVTFLPRPGDASSNALNHIFEQMFENPASHAGSVVKLKSTHLESPSIIAAFGLQMEMWGLWSPLAQLVRLDYQADKIQQPDPRNPKAQVPYTLWAWDGAMPRQAVARPDAQISRAVTDVASEPFHLEIWTPLAEQAARKLGAGAVPQLLASMVYPPRPNGGAMRVLEWTQRTQVAAALIIAHVDAGWAGSERQRALYSLMYGPSDWTVNAGIIAIGALARKDPAIKAEALQAFAWLQSQVPPEGFCAWEYPLVCTWQDLGPHDDVTTKRLAAWKDKVETEEGKSSVNMCELVAKGFDQAEEMNKAQAAAQQLQQGGGGDPDPVVFPGTRVAKLSDYVGIMKGMQTGNMMGTLGAYGLDMMGYSKVAMEWGQKLAQDPVLNAKFSAMMAR